MRERTSLLVAAAVVVSLLLPGTAGAYLPRGLKFDPVHVRWEYDRTACAAPGVCTTEHSMLTLNVHGYRCGSGALTDKWEVEGTAPNSGVDTFPDGSSFDWSVNPDVGTLVTPGQSGAVPLGTERMGLIYVDMDLLPGPPPMAKLTFTHRYTLLDTEVNEPRTVTVPLVRSEDCPDVYRIELKAWIPKAHVVDPVMPFALPYVALARPSSCFTPPTAFERTRTLVSTKYRGDAHTGYDGTYRVNPWVSFAWDGSHISNFTKSPDPEDYGTTHLDWTYNVLAGKTYTCTTEDKATKATTGVQVGSDGFELTIASSNPLVFPQFLVPDIDSLVQGTIDSNDVIHVHYRTDLFPSHGIRVFRNGEVLATDIVNDPSCLSDDVLLGTVGAGVLLYGLTHQDNEGSYDVLPDDSGRLFITPTKMCDPGFFDLEVTGGGKARLLAGGPSISVAPVGSTGIGAYVPLAEAARSGLVSTSSAGGRTKIVVDKAHSVSLRVTGSGIAVQSTSASRSGMTTTSYGPVNGVLVATAGASLSVTANGRPVTAKPPDRTPPVTRATVTRRGKTATVRFRATDASGVLATYVTVGGKAARLRNGLLRLPVKQLKSVRFASVDVFGNREQLRRLPGR